MKSLIKFTLLVSLSSLFVIPSRAAFTAIHVFGDSISTTASNSAAGSLYYGKRYANGRVWVEVLAQFQGLPFDPASNTNSFFGNTSDKLANQITAYTPPADASNALVVIWVNNADLYYPALYNYTLSQWNAVINTSLTNHFNAITALYAKGVRALIMPNVVDLSTIPQFNGSSFNKDLLHQECVSYNNAFSAMVANARQSCPGLTIIAPDYFGLLNNILAQPADYGVSNVLYNSLSVDALDDPSLSNKSLTGPGANYIFWDPTDPTAKVHFIMANLVQKQVSPVRISGLVQINGSNRLDLVNLPVGVSGNLENSTNLATGWTAVAPFSSTNTVQSFYVLTPPLPANFGAGDNGGSGGSGGPPMPGSTSTSSSTNTVPLQTATQLYRLKLVPAWTWP